MRLSQGVEWGLHCCSVLALLPHDAALPANRLAEFHGVPGPYLAKTLQALASAGLLESVPGRHGGYRLAKPPSRITLLDVVDAVEGGEPAFRCAEIRQRGPAGLPKSAYTVPCGIARAMAAAEAAYRQELRRRTLADVITQMAKDANPRAVAKAAAWMQEVTR